YGPPHAERTMGGMLSPAELARLDTLIPSARAPHDALIAAMTARGLEPYVGQCGRTPAQQQTAIAAGTTSAHQHISWHELGRAVDYRARLSDGSEDETTRNETFFRALFEEAGKIDGLRSLAYNADGSKILLNGVTWDAGHVELRTAFATVGPAGFSMRRRARRSIIAASSVYWAKTVSPWATGTAAPS